MKTWEKVGGRNFYELFLGVFIVSRPLCDHSKQEYTASGIQSNAYSSSWSRYVQHGQIV